MTTKAKQKLKHKEFKSTEKRFFKMAQCGVDLANYDVANAPDEPKRLTRSALKEKAGEVKHKLNYKFKNLHRDIFCGHPTIEDFEMFTGNLKLETA